MTTTTTAAGPTDPAARLDLYRVQVALRLFEQRAYDLFLENLVKGTSHLSLGQEAIAAGFAAAMRPDDWTFATYRGHAHTLARGVPMTPVLAELLGRTNGLMAGKGGSMHLTSVEHGVMGSYAIIGAHLPIACGAAWSAQYRGTDQVAVCFFGDGSTNIGAFHEALNFAAIWKLPVVFVCENNLWMEYTRTTRGDRGPPPGGRPRERLRPRVDHRRRQRRRRRLRRGRRPRSSGRAPARARRMIEAETYRHGGHSRADPGKYRPDDEVAEWLAKDPIPRYRDRLAPRASTSADLDAIEPRSPRRWTRPRPRRPRPAPVPGEDLLMKDVWADGGSAWRN